MVNIAISNLDNVSQFKEHPISCLHVGLFLKDIIGGLGPGEGGGRFKVPILIAPKGQVNPRLSY
jgi:hypothetical protein